MTIAGRFAAWQWFRGQGRATIVRVGIREATCPVAAVVDILPRNGVLLDWGCGHGVVGLLAAERAPELRVTGCEIDDAKVAGATRAADEAGLTDRVEFERVDASDRPTGAWDGIVLCDVLYLQAPAAQEELVRAAATALAPGGVLLCKEVGRQPAWKRWICRVQEQVSVRVLRITERGSALADFPDPATVGGWMAAEGLLVDICPIDRGFHVPHVAVVGRSRPEAESGDRARGW